MAIEIQESRPVFQNIYIWYSFIVAEKLSIFYNPSKIYHRNITNESIELHLTIYSTQDLSLLLYNVRKKNSIEKDNCW